MPPPRREPSGCQATSATRAVVAGQMRNCSNEPTMRRGAAAEKGRRRRRQDAEPRPRGDAGLPPTAGCGSCRRCRHRPDAGLRCRRRPDAEPRPRRMRGCRRRRDAGAGK
uniref:Uncharacterized protein n=1 Tax=Oryza barthii TaxID=65489 RepID=A0A679BAU7_9ORYZ|nr:hypothetical protein [Oryza barthii]